jgi:hypothetical protein
MMIMMVVMRWMKVLVILKRSKCLFRCFFALSNVSALLVLARSSLSLSSLVTHRKERNRIHAKLTRDRKKLFIEKMKQTIDLLEQHNSLVKESLNNVYKGKNYISLLLSPYSLPFPCLSPSRSSCSYFIV